MPKIVKYFRESSFQKLVIPFILVAAVLALLVSGLVQSYVIPAFLYVVLYIRIAYETLPQLLWWILLLLILLIIAVRSLFQRKNHSEENSQENRIPPSRLESWINTIEKSDRGGYFVWNLAHEISLLTITVYIDQDRLDQYTIATKIKTNQYDLTPEIQEYLLAGLDAQESFRSNQSVISTFFAGQKSALELDPEILINYLEEILDIENQFEYEVLHGDERQASGISVR